MLDEPAAVPDEPDPEATLALFNADPQLPTALITIDPSVAWVMDYYLIEPLDDVAETAPGTPIQAQMTYGSEDWLTRFVLGFGGRIRLMNAPGAAGEGDPPRRRRAGRLRRAHRVTSARLSSRGRLVVSGSIGSNQPRRS